VAESDSIEPGYTGKSEDYDWGIPVATFTRNVSLIQERGRPDIGHVRLHSRPAAQHDVSIAKRATL